MKDWLRQVFAKRVAVQSGRGKKVKFVEVLPSDRVVYGVMFAIVALICLVVLEVVYVVVFRSFNSEIFACVTFVIGTILGSFFVRKG